MVDYIFSDEKERICAYYRGAIIHYVITLEEIIDFYIVGYYLQPKIPKYISGLGIADLLLDYSEKEKDFIHTILEKQNFNLAFKKDALLFILYKHCKEEIDKYTELKRHIDYLVDIRNAFAHRKFNECNIEKKEITLIYYTTERKKPVVENFIMNPKELREFVNKYNYVAGCLLRVGDILMNKEIKSNVDEIFNSTFRKDNDKKNEEQ